MKNDIYRVNGPRIIFENIEGELILVHMEKGTYYSTDAIGAELWALIETGCSAAEMCDVLLCTYDATPAEVDVAVAAFLARLCDEELVATEASPGDRPLPSRRMKDQRLPFQPPALNAYRDMADMLSLDPIHDVEAAGWPVPRTDIEPAAAPHPAQ